MAADFIKGITLRTKAIFISHINSATALIIPVAEICVIAKQKGILTIIDGAHVPGQIPLDISALNADIYTGDCPLNYSTFNQHHSAKGYKSCIRFFT